ncbi:hypothetical protein, partial [Thiomonas sp.]
LGMAFILIFADVMIGIFRAHQRLSTLMPPEAMAAGDPGLVASVGLAAGEARQCAGWLCDARFSRA